MRTYGTSGPAGLGWRVERLSDRAILGWFSDWEHALSCAHNGFDCACVIIAVDPGDWRQKWRTL